jgi:hypothetical protein
MQVSRITPIAGLAIAAAAALFASIRPALAIPAWTRKYNVDCGSCHVAGFKLSRMGQDFLRSGHQMAGWEESKSIDGHVSVAQKSRFNWAKTQVDGETKPGSKTNSFEQHALSLYMGGPLEKNWAYFAELYWHENSGATSGSSDLNDYGRSKLADAYLQYFHRTADDVYTSARFGQFSPLLLHLHGVGARLSQDRPYVINSGTIGDNPYKGFVRQYGLELSQYYRGFNVAAAVMNGTGAKLFNRVDNDLKKDVYATADYTFDDQGSILGVYGYMGHYPLRTDNAVKYAGYDDFNQLGVLGNFTRKEGALVGALFTGNNEYSLTNEVAAPADTADTKIEQKSLGYYAELQIYGLHANVQPFIRYDFWDPDTDVDDNEVSGPLFGINWRALDWGRLVVHYQILKTEKGNSALDETRHSVTFEANFMY